MNEWRMQAVAVSLVPPEKEEVGTRVLLIPHFLLRSIVRSLLLRVSRAISISAALLC
jgi:hypothetical protein